MRIYVPTSALKAPAAMLRAAILRGRKQMPEPGCALELVAGGWGGMVIGSATCRGVRLMTRRAQLDWCYGTVRDHATLSGLDLEQLAHECGYDRRETLDARYADVKPNETLVKVTFGR